MDKRAQAPEVVVIIPARGGSKGVPSKNIAELGDLPLIGWTIKAALAAETISRVIVSTDDPQIAEISKEMGAEVPLLRPAELSCDRARIKDVITHLHTHLIEADEAPDIIVTLYPTSPFRTPALIDEIVDKCLRESFSVSTALVYAWNPGFWFGYRDGKLEPVSSRQGGVVYRTCGVVNARVCSFADYEGKQGEALLREHYKRQSAGDRRMYTPMQLVPITDPITLIDIDWPEDLERARQVVLNKQAPWLPDSKYSEEKCRTIFDENTLEQVEKKRVFVKSLDCANLSDAGCNELELENIPSPLELRSIVDANSEHSAKPVIVSNSEELTKSHELRTKPVIALDESCQQAFRMGLVTRIIASTQFHLLDAYQQEFGVAVGELDVETKNGQVFVELPREPQAGDRVIARNWASSWLTELASGFFLYDGFEWSDAPGAVMATGEETTLSCSGSARRLRFTPPEGTAIGRVDWARPGMPNHGEQHFWEGVQIDGFLSWKKTGNVWTNLVENKSIHGRQDFVPVYRWAGWLYLPAEVSEGDEWEIVFCSP